MILYNFYSDDRKITQSFPNVVDQNIFKIGSL